MERKFPNGSLKCNEVNCGELSDARWYRWFGTKPANRNQPLYWGNHLKDALLKQGSKQSVSDPCMYCSDGVIVLTYVDDCLFFGKDKVKINNKIQNIQASGLKLTFEDDIYAFLGVQVIQKENGQVELLQCGLNDKMLFTCGITNCNTKAAPCYQTPLGTNPEGKSVTGKFEYASAVGMLMYLSSNSCPDIQYAVGTENACRHNLADLPISEGYSR
jgi:hypothetical protein